MKKIFIAGLQRTGTNYTQSLINLNIDVNVWCDELTFEKEEDYGILWKHNVNPISDFIKQKYNIDGIILVIKNPYTWIESIVYRNYEDIIKYYNESYNLIEEENTVKFKINSLCRLYKDFYNNWMTQDVLLVKYTNLLSNREQVFFEFAKKFQCTIKPQMKEIEGNVPQSQNFDHSRIEKYKNFELSHLSNAEIEIINKELGEDFFNKIGYEMKSPK